MPNYINVLYICIIINNNNNIVDLNVIINSIGIIFSSTEQTSGPQLKTTRLHNSLENR